MMKLSEAIRLGAMLRPQAFGFAFSKGGSCALGAAQEAMGIKSSSFRCFEESPWYPIFRYFIAIQAQCPACGLKVTDSFSVFLIPHLNDTHRWSREQIADWLETLEPPDATTQEE